VFEGVIKAKWINTLMGELGFKGMGVEIMAETDSSAAKSFVCRRGLGRMWHVEVRDLWVQKEVAEGKVKVGKVKGEVNPADVMTKYLKLDIIEGLCGKMGVEVKKSSGKSDK
jgi:hypothetical protein